MNDSNRINSDAATVSGISLQLLLTLKSSKQSIGMKLYLVSEDKVNQVFMSKS